MSKLKVSAIHDPDNDNEAITVDTSGNVGVSQTASFDGNVGIGTTSPTTPLDINANGTGGNGLHINKDDTTGYYVSFEADLGSSNNRTYTLSPPSSDSNTAPFVWNTGNSHAWEVDGIEHMRMDSNGNLSFNNGFGSVGTVFGVRAWVQFNGSTGNIRNDGNVSSITDNGTGNFTINFSGSMPDSDYITLGQAAGTGNSTNPFVCSYGPSNTFPVTKNTNNVRVVTEDVANGTDKDSAYIEVAIIR